MQIIPSSGTSVERCLKYKHTGNVEWGVKSVIHTSDINKDVDMEFHDEKMIESFHNIIQNRKHLNVDSTLMEADEMAAKRALVIELEEEKTCKLYSRFGCSY